MSKSWDVSRRTVLRGLGTAVALPFLDAMAPVVAAADRGKAAALPIRMAFLYVPNGVHMPDWTPKGQGSQFELPDILKPLQAHKADFNVLTGLTQDGARDHGDGGGDHARSLACFLTGRHPLKTDGANIRAGVSADQVAAQKVGKATRFASLELGCDRGAQSGNCDSGYSCAYSSNISWRSENMPMAKEVDPKLVFERLFASRNPNESAAARARREAYRKSVLDFVTDDAGRLMNRLGKADQRKVDEYLTSIREIEQRLARADKVVDVDLKSVKRPTGIPADFQEHIRLMYDLMVLAFQTDSTRIATFMYANEGSNKSYKFLGVPEGHHDLSHHGKSQEKQAKIKKINLFHVEQFAYFLDRLKAVKEGSGSLLDHSMIVYGSGISDGDRHNHDDLPIILAGKGRGTVKTGRHLIYPRETPLNNLYLSMLDRMGASVPSLGDSKGKLPRLDS